MADAGGGSRVAQMGLAGATMFSFALWKYRAAGVQGGAELTQPAAKYANAAVRTSRGSGGVGTALVFGTLMATGGMMMFVSAVAGASGTYTFKAAAHRANPANPRTNAPPTRPRAHAPTYPRTRAPTHQPRTHHPHNRRATGTSAPRTHAHARTPPLLRCGLLERQERPVSHAGYPPGVAVAAPALGIRHRDEGVFHAAGPRPLRGPTSPPKALRAPTWTHLVALQAIGEAQRSKPGAGPRAVRNGSEQGEMERRDHAAFAEISG